MTRKKPREHVQEEQAEGPRRTTVAALALVVALAAVGCYYGTLSAGFVNWDDTKLIVENPYIRGLSWDNLSYIWTHPIKETYLPLRATSYAVDYALWGLNPTGFHLTNILLHAICALLVFAIAKRLTGALAAAFVAGMVFAVHPVHSEAVVWASGRKDVLSTALFLGAYLLYLMSMAGEKRRWVMVALSLVAFVLSGLAKAMVVTLPALIIITDFLYGGIGGRRWMKRLPVWGAYFAAAGLVTFIAVHFAAQARAIVPYHFGGAGRTAAFMTWVALFYAKTMLLPNFLSARYPYGDTVDFGVPDAIVYLSPAVLALVLAAAAWLVVRARARRFGQALPWVRLAALGVAWFFIGLAPVMNLVSINVLVADRYLYLPSVGFALLVAAVLWHLWEGGCEPRGASVRRVAAAVVLVGMVGADAARTYTRNSVWQSSVALWRSVTNEFPGSSQARLLLASAYADPEVKDYQKALDEVARAEALAPASGEAHLVRGRIYDRMGKADLARVEYEKAAAMGVARGEDEYGLLLSQAAASEAAGDLAGAATILERAIRSAPAKPEAYNNLGHVYERLGNGAKAESLYLEATRADARFARAWYNLGLLAAQRKDISAAAGYYSKALEADPAFAEAMVNLASMRIAAGDAAGAVGLLESAVALRGDLMPAHMNLFRAYAMLGETQKARRELETVLSIEPGNAAVQEMLRQYDRMTKGGR